jgi:hypothetical protein
MDNKNKNLQAFIQEFANQVEKFVSGRPEQDHSWMVFNIVHKSGFIKEVCEALGIKNRRSAIESFLSGVPVSTPGERAAILSSRIHERLNKKISLVGDNGIFVDLTTDQERQEFWDGYAIGGFRRSESPFYRLGAEIARTRRKCFEDAE